MNIALILNNFFSKTNLNEKNIESINKENIKSINKENIESINNNKDNDFFKSVKNLKTINELSKIAENMVEHNFNMFIYNRKNIKKIFKIIPDDKTQINYTIEENTKFKDDGRFLKDFTTDFITSQVISNSGLYNFMYIIWYVHKLFLDRYKHRYDIDTSDIIFIFKGGNFLHNLSSSFWHQLPGEAVEYLIGKYKKYFKKSDMDYTIYINPKIDNYKKIFEDIKLLAFKAQVIIREIFFSNTFIPFQWFKSSAKYQRYILNNYLKRLQNNVAPEHVNDINNKEYYGVRFMDMSYVFNSKYGTYIPTADKLYVYDPKKKNEIADRHIPTNPNQYPAYITINETLNLTTPNGYKTHFDLVRTKLAFNYKIKKDNEILIKNMGGELIDVSIPHSDDSDIEEFFSRIHLNTKPFKFKQVCPNQVSYFVDENETASFLQHVWSLDYIHYDLLKTIFKTVYYPWEDNKYIKRLYRIFYLCHIDFFSTNVIKNSNEIQMKIKKFKYIRNIIDKANKLIYKSDRSIFNYFKYNNNNKKMCRRLKTEISQHMIETKNYLDQTEFQNKFIIKALKQVITVTEKILLNHNLHDTKIHNINIPKNPNNIIPDMSEDLQKLGEFLDHVIINLDIVIELFYKIELFCKTKTINADELLQYRFSF